MTLEACKPLVDRGQEIATVEQRRQRVALGHALELGDRDLEDAVFAAQRVAFAAQFAQLVVDGVNGREAGPVDRDPCPPCDIHSQSPNASDPPPAGLPMALYDTTLATDWIPIGKRGHRIRSRGAKTAPARDRPDPASISVKQALGEGRRRFIDRRPGQEGLE